MGKFINNDQAKRIRSILESDEELTPEEEQRLVGLLREHSSRGGIDVPNQSPIDLKNVNVTAGRDKPFYNPIGAGLARAFGQHSPRDLEDAESGIDVLSGAPYDLRNSISLTLTDEQIQNKIVDYFKKKGHKTFARKRDGEWEYLSPEGRVTRVNPIGLDAPTAGGAMDFVGETTGGLGGAALGAAEGLGLASFPLAALGAGTGTVTGNYLSNMAKYNIGKVTGTTEDMSLGEAQAVAKNRATDIAPWAFGAEGAAALGFVAKRWVQGVRLSPKKAREALVAYRNGEQLLQEYYNLGGDVKWRPTVPEAVGYDPKFYYLVQAEDRALSNSEVQRMRREHWQNGLLSLEDTYTKILDQYKVDNPQSVGGTLQELYEKAAHAKRLEIQLAEGNAKLDAIASGMPADKAAELTKEKSGLILKNIVNPAWEASKLDVKEKYKTLAVALGVNPSAALSKAMGVPATRPAIGNFKIKLDDRAIAEIRAFTAEARASGKMDTRTKAQKIAALPNRFVFKGPKKGTETKSSGLVAPDGTPLTAPKKPTELEFLGGKEVDAYSYLEWLQDTRSGIRADFSANKGIKLKDTDIAEVEKIFDANFQRYLAKNKPDAVPLYEEARAAAKAHSDIFERGVLNRLVKKSGGTEPITDYAAFGAVIRGNDSSGAVALRKILGGDPKALQNVRDIFFSMWAREVRGPDGVVTKAKTERFLNKYSGSLPIFFDEQAIAKMRHVGDMEDVINAYKKDYDAFESAWKKTKIGKISNLNTAQITRHVFSGNASERTVGAADTDIAEVVQILKAHSPETLESLRNQVATQFYNNTIEAVTVKEAGSGMGRQGVIPVYSAIESSLRKNEARIALVMGDQYVKNLKTVAYAGRVMGDRMPVGPGDEVPVFRAFIRALFIPPLSRAGTTQTLGVKLRHEFSPAVMGRVLANPEGLEWLIKNHKKNIKTAAALAPMSNIGLSWLWHQYNDE